MHNSRPPSDYELPTARRLVVSTVVAAGIAGALLFTVVLPAEYGTDPTGIGNLLGLKTMGEIKQSLAAEAADEKRPVEPAPVATPGVDSSSVPVAAASQERVQDLSLQLEPGEAAEIKLSMVKDALVHYDWSVEGGVVNFDTHGDPVGAPKDFYHGYAKGRQVDGDKGSIQAAFDGKHGWFWRNRGETPVTLRLAVRGRFTDVKRVL